MGDDDAFVLDPRIAASSHPLARLPLCEARLQEDARFAWIVLVPRRQALVELMDLTAPDRLQLAAETAWAGEAVRAIGAASGRAVFKLNHGQLGNVVPQLHLHVVGRRPNDPAWPGTVWGCGAPEPYDSEALTIALATARGVLG